MARKTVTVLSDVAGSTAMGERLDPEALRRVMTRYFEVSRATLERHGATVEKFIGGWGFESLRAHAVLRWTRSPGAFSR